MRRENRNVCLNKPMSPTELRDINKDGWHLLQVVTERSERGLSADEFNRSSPYERQRSTTVFRYHHFFERQVFVSHELHDGGDVKELEAEIEALRDTL